MGGRRDRGDKNLLWRSLQGGEFFQVEGNEQIFGWWEDSPIPPVGKTMTLALFFYFLVPFNYDFMLIYFIRMTIWETFLSSNGGIKNSVVMQFLAEISHRLFKMYLP